jgi:hypothetical protein
MAICAVGKALESLEDSEARLRVLRWAYERYQLASTAVAPASVAPAVVAPVAVPAVAGVCASRWLRSLLCCASRPPRRKDLEFEFEPQVGLAMDLEFDPAERSEPEPDLTTDSLEDLFDLEAPSTCCPRRSWKRV